MTRQLALGIATLTLIAGAAAEPPARESAVRTRSAREARTAPLLDSPGGRLLLLASARDRDPRARATTARALAELPTSAALPVLERLLRDPDEGVRGAAVGAAIRGHDAAGWALVTRVLAADPDVAASVRGSLRHHVGVHIRARLQALLGEDGWLVGVYPRMCDGITRYGRWAVEPLMRILWHRPPEQRRPWLQILAAHALSELGETSVAAELHRIHATLGGSWRNWHLAESLALALARLGDADLLDRMMDRYTRRASFGWGRSGMMWYRLGWLQQRLGRLDDAISSYESALGQGANRWTPQVHYNLACAHAMKGEPGAAFEHLGKALETGFGARRWIARDGRLDPIRADPRFARVLAAPRDPVLPDANAGD